MARALSTAAVADGDGAAVRSAARGSALNLFGAVTAAVLGFVTVGVITNNYGRVGAGLFFSATAIYTLAANATRLGGESALTFFVSRLRAAGRGGAVRSVVTTALTATAIASVLAALIGVLLAPSLADWLTSDADNRATMTTMVRILAVGVPAFALSQSMFGATRAFGTMRPSVIAGQIVRPVAQLVLVTLAVVLSTELWPAAAAWAFSGLLMMLIVGWWLRRRLGTVVGRADPVAPGRYWRFAGPRALSDLVSSALERVDILLVAYLLSEADAGLYGVSNRLVVAGQLLMYATAQASAPQLAGYFERNRLDSASSLLNTITSWNVTLLWPALFALAFGAEPVLGLFGDEFGDAAPVAVVLAVSLLVVVGIGMGDTLLLMTGDSVASLINHLVSLAVMIGASVVLLPRIGVVGAAYAWGLSRVLLRGLAVVRVWRSNGVHSYGRSVIAAVAAATVAWVPTGFVAHRLLADGFGAIIVHIALAGLIHAALAYRLRRQLELDRLVRLMAGRVRGSAALPDPDRGASC